MNKSNDASKYPITISDWLQFLQNIVSTDINIMISSAGLVTAIGAVGVAVLAFTINNPTLPRIVAIIIIFILAIGLTYFYYHKTRKLKGRSLLKEIDIAQELIEKILNGNISNIEEHIKKKWFGKD